MRNRKGEMRERLAVVVALRRESQFRGRHDQQSARCTVRQAIRYVLGLWQIGNLLADRAHRECPTTWREEESGLVEQIT